jgi:hypothetical protein
MNSAFMVYIPAAISLPNSPLALVIPPPMAFGFQVLIKVMVAYSSGCLLVFSMMVSVILTFFRSGLPCAKVIDVKSKRKIKISGFS